VTFAVILAHLGVFIGGTLTVAVLYARVRATDQAFKGEPVDRNLLDPGFSLLALLFFGLPAIGCGLYLHGGGFDESGLMAAFAATAVGIYLGHRRANRIC
jgi:hypothetical protein